jgi:predicted nucleic-acid-binding Zn-ribbon protein
MSSSYQCIKCGHDDYTSERISAEGGIISRFFNVSTKKFTAISCKKCGYTELYKGNASLGGKIVDFLGG